MQRSRKNPSLTKKSKSRPQKRSRGPRMAIPQMSGAPAGVSQDLQQFTNFLPHTGGKERGLKIHSCAAIFEVNKESGTLFTNTGLHNGAAPVTDYKSVQMNMTEPRGLSFSGSKVFCEYMTPIFDLIASAFVRYRVKKLVFHYEPQASATDGQRLVFAFANDPMHPLLWNASPPTQSTLLSLADSIAFMPWRAWSMDVTEKVSGDRLYTYSDPTLTVGEFTERFSDFGVISLLTDTLGSGENPVQCGVLYMETIIELEEFCPISVTLPSSLAVLSRTVASHGSRKVTSVGRPTAETPSAPRGACVGTPGNCGCERCHSRT